MIRWIVLKQCAAVVVLHCVASLYDVQVSSVDSSASAGVTVDMTLEGVKWVSEENQVVSLMIVIQTGR